MAVKLKHDDQATINLTPMIDIVFLLIIFFMVGTRFSELDEAERNIALQVPHVTNSKALTDAPRKKIINVLKDGSIVLDGQTVSLDLLHQKLSDAKQQYQKTGVVVRGDSESFYQYVADVIATCKSAEITDLSISVRVVNHESTLR